MRKVLGTISGVLAIMVLSHFACIFWHTADESVSADAYAKRAQCVVDMNKKF